MARGKLGIGTDDWGFMRKVTQRWDSKKGAYVFQRNGQTIPENIINKIYSRMGLK